MSKPIWKEIQEKPVTASVVMFCTAVWLLINQRRWGYDTVGSSFQKVVLDNQYWRLFISPFAHVDLIHLVMNMSSLWSLRYVEASPRLGKFYYIKVTLLLLVVSKTITLAFYYVLVNIFKKEYYRKVVSIGYSSVVFGWMSNLSIVQPRRGRYSLLGLPSIPMSLAPFASLISTQIMIPKASFLGHLGGILAGYLIGFGCFNWLNLFWILSLVFWTIVGVLVHLIRTERLNLPFLQFENPDLAEHHNDEQILINRIVP